MSRLAPFAAAALAAAPVQAAAEGAGDPHSASRPQEVAVSHLDLDLTVDFEARRLSGVATLTLDRRSPGARELVLDTRDLEISSVTLDGEKAAAEYRLGETSPSLAAA